MSGKKSGSREVRKKRLHVQESGSRKVGKSGRRGGNVQEAGSREEETKCSGVGKSESQEIMKDIFTFFVPERKLAIHMDFGYLVLASSYRDDLTQIHTIQYRMPRTPSK